MTWATSSSGVLSVTYSQHYCPVSPVLQRRPLGFTDRVINLAVRLVVEDGLPYRPELWRDQRVFVPFATLQNWVEAGGKKRAGPATDFLDLAALSCP